MTPPDPKPIDLIESRIRVLALAAGPNYWPTSEQFGAEWDKKTSDLLAALSPDVVLRIAAVVEAARKVAKWDGAGAEPCWRCGGGGSYCEERIGDLELCRCCGGEGDHCEVVNDAVKHLAACVKHNPKERVAECQKEPELFAALAALDAVEEKSHD